MAMVRERNGRFELRVKHKLLPKIFTATFTDESAAKAYGEQLEMLLASGRVPQELVARRRSSRPAVTMHRVIADFLAYAPVSASDRNSLDVIHSQVASVRVEVALQYRWAESWVQSMKLGANLAPGTIRKRVGSLARALDWYLKRVAEEGKQPLANPLRMLPKNYSTYSAHERQTIERDPKLRVKVDQERDRRLEPGEYERIVDVLKGAKREDRERPLELPEGDALLELFTLIVHTGLRLREAYTLRVEHVRLADRTIHVAHSKTGKPRDVPIVPAIFDMLTRRVAAVTSGGDRAPIFPWWSGRDSEKELTLVSMRLSRAFARAFAYAGCVNLRAHDLRHEATCRWVLMRDANGAWMFRSEELMKITGHRNPVIFMRYVSLRGSDLAARLWTATGTQSQSP